MSKLDSYVPSSFMAVFAHPDDIEFSCAGTAAKWIEKGARAAYVQVTSGDVGIAWEGMTKERATEIREKETLAAAAVVGVTDVTFLREPDGMVVNDISLRRKIVREIRRFKPEVIITGDPTLLYTPRGGVNHPDHRAVGGAAIDAVFPASGQPNLFEELAEEGFLAHKVRKIYVSSFGDGTTYVDISDKIELKIEALLKHDSQLGHIEGFAEGIRKRSADRAADSGAKHAERFRVLTIEGDETWERLCKEKPDQYQPAIVELPLEV